MINTYTVRDPDNPDLLLDVDVFEQDDKEPIDYIGYKRQYYDFDEDYKTKVLEGDDDVETPQPKNEQRQKIQQNVERDGKRLLLRNRHVYRFICMLAAKLGVYTVEKLLRDPEKNWENQAVFVTADSVVYEVPETSAEILEQTLNGIYYGAIESAYLSIEAFRYNQISLSSLVDCIKPDSTSDPKILEMFLKYTVLLFKAGTVAGFSAQPGRVYTKNGSVALNIHAGTQHRLEVTRNANMYLIWFAKVKSEVKYRDDTNEIVSERLYVVELTTGSPSSSFSNYARDALRRAGLPSAAPEIIVKDEPDVKKIKVVSDKGKEEESD
jgi:hypothetical protein